MEEKMQRKIIITIIVLGIVVLLGTIIMFSRGPRYGYRYMYGPDYEYDDMMGPGYGYGRMMGPGYGEDGMMGPGYGDDSMIGPGYGYGRRMGPGYGYGGMRGSGYGNMAFNYLQFMRSDLSLTEEQTKQLYDLAEKYRRSYFENRGNVQEIDKLEQQHRKEIEKILTPEQRKLFNKYQRGFDRYGWFGGCPYR